ncbi:MAG: hypothetical protein VB118_07145 [Oscillospiraceae bacterium]|nr:hypothetical protein [Oscillospiraceae bacterium]
MDYIILVYNGNLYVSQRENAQEAISDLYDYVGGKIDSKFFRSIVMKLTIEETTAIYDKLSSEAPLNAVYTGCNKLYERKENESDI